MIPARALRWLSVRLARSARALCTTGACSWLWLRSAGLADGLGVDGAPAAEAAGASVASATNTTTTRINGLISASTSADSMSLREHRDRPSIATTPSARTFVVVG
jgi:hypothetical protein